VLGQDYIFSKLSRRIGYSAGLDNLPERIKRVVKHFNTQKLSLNSLEIFLDQDGIKKGGKTQESFFGILEQMGFISRSGNGLIFEDTNFFTLKYLESSFEGDKQFNMAADIVNLAEILHVDGEVFANLLETDFSDKPAVKILSRMSIQKFELLSNIYPSRIFQKNLWNSIKFGIEKLGPSSPIGAYEESEIEGEFKGLTTDTAEKLISPRLSWVRNFQLEEEIRKHLLTGLRKITDYKSNKNSHIFWPENYELVTFRITEKLAPEELKYKLLILSSEIILRSQEINYKNKKLKNSEVIIYLKELLEKHKAHQIQRSIFLQYVISCLAVEGFIPENLIEVIDNLRESGQINLLNLKGRGGALKLNA